MDELTRLTEVLEGYAELAAELATNWASFLHDLSTKAGTGAYGPDEAAADFPAAARLALTSLMAIGSEAVDALAIMTSDFSEETTEGGLTLPAAKTSRTLAVKADFTSVTGKVLPKDRITIVPNHLAPGETQFALEVDGDGLKARTYDGWVVATDADGAEVEVKETVTIG